MRSVPITITREQARRLILLRQGLLGKYRFAGKDGAYRYVRQAGCIQYDPVDVCGKNAELTLLSRVKGFTKKTLADLLYKDRLLVDYADKELAIWAREDWPYFAPYRERSRVHGKQFQGLSELEEEAIPVRGAVRSACDILGLDPLYCANEGKLLAVVAPERAADALALLKDIPGGEDAAVIGEITDAHPGKVLVKTRFGALRILAKLAGAQLPRIC